MARGFMKKRGKMWYAVFPWQGKKKWVPLARSQRAAEPLFAKVMDEVHAGTWKPASKLTFEELADRWLESKKLRVRGSTLHGYKNIVRHLREHFGPWPIAQIDKDDIEDYIKIKASDGILGNKTIGYHLGTLKAIFKYAIPKHIKENPAHDITRPRPEEIEVEYLSPTELKILLETCFEKFPDRYLFVLTDASTGLRWGEITELRWKDFNPQSSQLRISRGVWEGDPQDSPKSEKSKRNVLIPESLRDLLVQLRDVTGARDEDLIFPSSTGKHIHHSNFYRDVWNGLIEAAGVKPITFHGLRHTYATVMLSNGASILFVSKQLGHSDIQTTLKYYGHVLPEDAQAYVKNFEKTVLGSNIVAGKQTRFHKSKKTP